MMRPALGELLRYFIRRGTTGFGGMAWLQGAFYGVGAAVIAIIARSAAQLALVARGRTNDTGQSAASFAFVFPASTTLTSVIDGKWFLTGLAGVASLAIVPFLHGGVVLQHHWLSEQQFLDAVAVALIAALRAVQIQSARSRLYRWSHCGGDQARLPARQSCLVVGQSSTGPQSRLHR